MLLNTLYVQPITLSRTRHPHKKLHFKEKSAFSSRFSKKTSTHLERARSSAKTSAVQYILIAAVIIDILTAGIKLFTWWKYTRKINKIKAKMQTQLLEFYRKQQMIKREVCLLIRQANVGYIDLFNSLLMKFTILGRFIATKFESLGFFEKPLSEFQSTPEKIKYMAYTIHSTKLTEAMDSIENMISFVKGFENLVCTYSVDLAGENTLFKSRVKSLVAPKASKSSSAFSLKSIMASSVQHFFTFWSQSLLFYSLRKFNSTIIIIKIVEHKLLNAKFKSNEF